MNKKLLAILACVCMLLVCVGALIACNEKCEHNFVDGVCTKCNEPDPDYVQPKIDYDMSGVKFQDKSVVFNGQEQTLTVTGTLPTGVTVSYAYYSNADRTEKVTEVKLPATYYVTASFSGDDKHNKPDDMKATLTITNADYDMSGIKFENKAVAYNGQAQTIAITGTLPDGVTVEYKYYSDSAYTTQVDSAVEKGVYYVLATFTGAQGYNKPANMKATLTVTGFDLGDVKFTNKTVVYNGEEQTLTLTGTLPEGLSVEYKYYSDEACQTEATEIKNAGTYYVTAIITDAEQKSETLKATLTIEKADVTGISLGDVAYDYDGEAKSIAIIGNLPMGITVSYKFYSDADCTAEVAAADVKNAGVYYAKAIFTVNGNYNQIPDKVARLTIRKLDVDMEGVTFEDKTVEYTGEVLTMEITGTLPEGIAEVVYEFYSDANCTDKVENANVVNAGVYYVKATFVTDVNHNAVQEMYAVLTVKGGAFEDITEQDVKLSVTATYKESIDSVTAKLEGNDYTFDYYPGRKYELAVDASVEGKNISVDVQYFKTKNSDGTLADNIGRLTKPTLENYGDALYAQVTLYEGNHEMTLVVTLRIAKYTVELKTFEDLWIMRDHIYGNEEKGIAPISTANRRGIRYILANGIDCEGKLWTPVTYILDLSAGISGYVDSSFVSEFDGQGHKISNYRITEESFDAEAVNALDVSVKILHVGFFGRVNNGLMSGNIKNDLGLEQDACNIHDVTFSNVTIKIDVDSENYKFDSNVAVYAGFVTGYLDSGNWHTVGRTNLYNITVENSTMDIDANKSHVGGIIGYEDIAHNYAGLRYNLNVNNCEIYGVSSRGTNDTLVYVGGLVGRFKGNNSGGADADATWWTRYNDSHVRNVKLGWNYEAWNADNLELKNLQSQLDVLKGAETTDENTAKIAELEQQIAALKTQMQGYLHVMGGNIRVGAYFGYNDVMNITFKNCSVENYLIAHTSPSAFYTGLISDGVGSMLLVDNTVQDEAWNNGLHGIYGVPNDDGVVTKQEITTDLEKNKWLTTKNADGTFITEVNGYILDRKENVAMEYLGLNK